VPGKGRFGLAYTSFVIRMLQGRDVLRGGTAAGLPAMRLVELCHEFGAAGAQLDHAQLETLDGESLRALRRAAEERGLFLELSLRGHALEDESAFAAAAAVSRALGITRWRTALVYARRYEDFHDRDEWEAFLARWRAQLPRAASWLEREGIEAGIENHKDLTAAEQAALLREVGSPALGACLDLGNNLALLEDPMETVETLAPYVVTTHLKDMAVRPSAHGFELAEVPLGTGLLPLPRMVAAVRAARPDVNLCLEMITRDPLPVPYRDEAYWSTYTSRDAARVASFESSVLGRAATAPLPRVAGLDLDGMLAAEDANVRECVAYAAGQGWL
jgi:sugar phosphate isomerase/epimerase